MAGITLAQAESKLALYLSALDKIILGQKVEIDGQSLTRANLSDVEAAINSWDRRVKHLASTAAGRGRARTIVVGG
jgi:hypothetical protein